METNVIVSPEPLSRSPIDRPGQCGSHFPVVRSPVNTVVGSTSSAALVCSTCVQCQPIQSQQEQPHYHEIGQTPLTNPSSNSIMIQPPSCCCGASGGAPAAGPAYYHHPQSRHRHQHSLPESDSGSQQGNRRVREGNRNYRGNILTSSTENLQSGCESHCGRRKKRWLLQIEDAEEFINNPNLFSVL